MPAHNMSDSPRVKPKQPRSSFKSKESRFRDDAFERPQDSPKAVSVPDIVLPVTPTASRSRRRKSLGASGRAASASPSRLRYSSKEDVRDLSLSPRSPASASSSSSPRRRRRRRKSFSETRRREPSPSGSSTGSHRSRSDSATGDADSNILTLKQKCIDELMVQGLVELYEPKQQQQSSLSSGDDSNEESISEVRIVNCFVTSDDSLRAMVQFLKLIGVKSLWIEDDTKSFGDREMTLLVQSLDNLEVTKTSLETLSFKRVQMKKLGLGLALQKLLQRQGSILRDLSVDECTLNQGVYQSLLEGIRNYGGGNSLGLRNVQIQKCGLNNKLVEHLVQALLSEATSTRTTLESFGVSHSPKLDMGAFVPLALLVKKAKALKDISLRECPKLFEDSDDAKPYLKFCQAVQKSKTLQTLDLGYCGCTEDLLAPLHQAMEAKTQKEGLKTWIFTENFL